MPHRFLAIVINLQTRLAASAQTSNPSNSSKGSGAVLLGKKLLSVVERNFRGQRFLGHLDGEQEEKDGNVEEQGRELTTKM